MRERGQHNRSNAEQKLRPTGRSIGRAGRGIFRLPRGKGGLILLVIVMATSYYQSTISNFFTSNSASETQTVPHESVVSPDSEATEFTTTIMATLEETWQTLFQHQGLHYQIPKLIMYRDPISSACDSSNLAIGTFYCPQDDTLYVSLTLYDDMKNVLGAGGDFTQGYVIAHAVGHHIQTLLGLNDHPQDPVTRIGNSSSEQELQADCFAGLWGHRMAEQQILSAGDQQQALNVAEAINEEQRQLHSGLVMPEDFSYATLEQRYQRFNRGFVTGELEQCLNAEPAFVKP